ncbi:unnamed protein product [Rotaria socialis]|uniref:Uncharacterized protein n=1 Tax=Rotaria socialis TaxID=392032 RepID=A0A817Y5R3_9BILA|nr:unnamed protein product [Rotaria socialis]CAF3376414.1 unnamed protein product [Rotaria socialis]
MHHACALQRLQLVRLYLSCLDFNIDTKDCEGNTCLHYAAITGNCDIAELIIRSAEKFGIRLDQYVNREGNFVLFCSVLFYSIDKYNHTRYVCFFFLLLLRRLCLGCSAAALALKYGHIECANQITHRDWDEFFVVPRPLSIYESPSCPDGNQTIVLQTKKKSASNKKSETHPSSLSFGLLKIIFNDSDTSYSHHLAGLCKQVKQHRHHQHSKHNKHEAPQTSTAMTINKLDRTKSTLVNGTQYSSTEAVVNETQSTKEHQRNFDANGNLNGSNRSSPRTQLLVQQNHLNKSTSSHQNSCFIQKTTSKTQLSIDDLNSTKFNNEGTKSKTNKSTTYVQTSHSTFNRSENTDSRTKSRFLNSTTSMLNNQTFIHSSTSQASSSKIKATAVLSTPSKTKLSSNNHLDSVKNHPRHPFSFVGSDSSTYSQTLYAGRSVSAIVQQSNAKSNDSSCSIHEAKERTCRYNKPEELFGLRPEELFAPEQHQPKIIDQNSSINTNETARLKRNQLQKQQYMWQHDVDKIINLYNVHHCANYRKPATQPPPTIPATQTVAQSEANGESTTNGRSRRGSITKHNATNLKSSNYSKQSLNTSLNIPRRNSISRPSIKLTNA